METKLKARPLFDPPILRRAIRDSFVKLGPRQQLKNPVMFVVFIGAIITTLIIIRDPVAEQSGSLGFNLQIALWLWFTVLFANFAEAMAEGRGKAQADSLRKTRKEMVARRVVGGVDSKKEERVSASELKKGDLVVCEAGDRIPGDGEVVDGIASVDESAITGESAPFIGIKIIDIIVAALGLA
jgi:potassium-transporting ATPase ATP-binding subunit